MKKTLLLLLSSTAFSFLIHATTVTCVISPTQIPGGVGNAALACPGLDAGPGNILGNVQLLLAGDYVNGPSGTTSGTTVHEVYTPASGPFGVHTEDITGGFSSSGSTTDGNPNVGGGPFLAQTVFINAQTLTGFTINVASSVTAGGPVNASTVNGFLNYTPSSTNPAPEPATAGLIGAGLLGVGLLARRKKA